MAGRFSGVTAPTGLRAVLLQAIEARDPEVEEGPLALTARLVGVATPGIWGHDVSVWVRDQVSRLSDTEVFEALEEVLAGSWSSDERVNEILRREEVPLRMVDGSFYDEDPAAEELEVTDVLYEAAAALRGPYAHVGQQWQEAQHALRSGSLETAVALAVNALEGAVRTATQKKSIHDGLRALFPDGPRKPLVDAIVQLHNYGSAMPNVRHGGARPSTLGELEARAVIRASGVWISMVVALEHPTP